MSVEDSDDRLVFFDPDDFALSGTYTPASGPAVAVRLLDWKPDLSGPLGTPGLQLAPAAQDAARTVWLLRDQVAAPARGATVTIAGEVYPVRDVTISPDGQIWQLDLGKPA